jgi:hypothetical protein
MLIVIEGDDVEKINAIMPYLHQELVKTEVFEELKCFIRVSMRIIKASEEQEAINELEQIEYIKAICQPSLCSFVYQGLGTSTYRNHLYQHPNYIFYVYTTGHISKFASFYKQILYPNNYRCYLIDGTQLYVKDVGSKMIIAHKICEIFWRSRSDF